MVLQTEFLRRQAGGFGTYRRVVNVPRPGGISREGLYQRGFILLSLEVWLRRTGLTW